MVRMAPGGSSPAKDVKIRPYQAEDYHVVLPMWQYGFLEMAAHIHAKAVKSPVMIVSAATVGAVAWAVGHPVVGAAFTAMGVLMYTPLGASVTNALLWQGIMAQTRQSMQPKHLLEEWRKPGVSAFWVAVDAASEAGSAEEDAARKAAAALPYSNVNGKGERILGCVGVKKYHTLHKERLAGVPLVEGEASVWRLSVHSDARGKGVGKQLMETAEAWAKEQGCTHVSLITGNPESQKFYRRIGYSTETLPRACTVLFGAPGAIDSTAAARPAAGDAKGAGEGQVPLGVWGQVKKLMLGRRLKDNNSIMVMQL